MRWIKHLTAARLDEDMSDLIHECGLEGYGFWWVLLEVIGGSMDETDKCELTYPLPQWSRLLCCHSNRVGKYLGKLQGMGKVTVENREGKVMVRIPNLLKYRDEYSKKSGHSPDKVRSKDRDRETQTKRKKEKPSPLESKYEPQPEAIPVKEVLPAPKSNLAVVPVTWNSDERFRSLIEKIYSAHKKYDKRQDFDHVQRMLYTKYRDGELDLDILEARHGPYAAYWEGHAWGYDAQDLLQWIGNRMPEPPKAQASHKLTHNEQLIQRLNREV